MGSHLQVRLFFVNHKVLPPGDPASSHLRARELFLDAVGAPPASVIAPNGSGNPQASIPPPKNKTMGGEAVISVLQMLRPRALWPSVPARRAQEAAQTPPFPAPPL